MERDIVFCNGIELSVEIGFREAEIGVLQTVSVDITLDADFRAGPERDDHEGLVDYYEVVSLLERRVEGRRYDLLEALAVDLAYAILSADQAVRVRVRVTKHPLDMKRVGAVGVECVRTAADLPREL